MSSSQKAPKPRKLGANKVERQRIDHKGQEISGWLFVLPMIIILGVFMFIPIIMALWVSVSNWSGRGTPFGSSVDFVGLKNYSDVLTAPGLAQSDFGTALRNNAWYTLIVVPLQTLLSLGLAVMLNRKILKARGFFRTAFYFPSVTSSVAITVLWLFLFNAAGPINAMLKWFGVNGPNWFNDPRGIIHILLSALGVKNGPAALAEHSFLGVSAWDWLAGPSVAMVAIILMVIFTTSGTFMLMFVAALQSIGEGTEEAAIMDGATPWQRMWKVTVPQLKPTIRHIGHHRYMAGVRSDLYGYSGWPGKDHADHCVPVVHRSVQQPGMGSRRGYLLHPIRHHHRHDLDSALGDEGQEDVSTPQGRLRGHESRGTRIEPRRTRHIESRAAGCCQGADR